jgi:hypothetical protein
MLFVKDLAALWLVDCGLCSTAEEDQYVEDTFIVSAELVLDLVRVLEMRS